MRIRFLAIGLIATALAGCTSSAPDPKPSPTSTPPGVTTTAPTSSTPPPPSPTQTGPLTTGPNVKPGEKPPTLPTPDHTAAGAAAFGAYYFSALDWAIATNNASPIQQISLSSCQACTRASAAVSLFQSKREIELDGRIHVKTFGIDDTKYKIKSDYVVRVGYDEDAVQLVAANGSKRTTSPAVYDANSLVFVSWVSGRWRVNEVTSG